MYSVVVDVERHDKALCCAVPHPQKAVGSFVIPFPPPSPPSQQCTIDSSLQLVAKASRSWIMKCSCGEKKKKRKKERGCSFHAKQFKTLPSFASSGTCRSQNTRPLQSLSPDCGTGASPSPDLHATLFLPQSFTAAASSGPESSTRRAAPSGNTGERACVGGTD